MKELLSSVPKDFHEVFTEIVKVTDVVCEKHLNDDYQQLCRELAVAVCQKGSPVTKGRPGSWASGIVHAIGWVNFLQDPARLPHMTSAQLAKSFGVSQGTMTAKSKIIRDALNLMPLDPDWCLSEMLADNPLVWMVEVNGLVMDMRNVSRELQEIAFMKGLIPFIPKPLEDDHGDCTNEAKILKFPSRTNAAKSSTKPEDDRPSLFDGLE